VLQGDQDFAAQLFRLWPALARRDEFEPEKKFHIANTAHYKTDSARVKVRKRLLEQIAPTGSSRQDACDLIGKVCEQISCYAATACASLSVPPRLEPISVVHVGAGVAKEEQVVPQVVSRTAETTPKPNKTLRDRRVPAQNHTSQHKAQRE
jgi:hypothetical protein